MAAREHELAHYFEQEFTQPQSAQLAKAITDAYTDLVKTGDFNELKEIVRDLAGAQERTEQRMNRLADAQERTEEALRLLAESMRQTQEEVAELSRGLRQTRTDVGGLARSFGYALENEAYRALPVLLRQRYAIDVNRRFVRTFVGEVEINLLAEGTQAGEPVLVVGEAKSRLGIEDLPALVERLAAVRQAQEAGALPAGRIVPLFVTHMARPAALQRAEAEGIIVIQSFEW